MVHHVRMRQTDGSRKILYLESLRGLAALGVALHHSRLDSPLASNVITQNAWLLVDFFFVLSGFVIALNYQNAIRDGGSLLAFQYKRFLRLYPLHLVMLFVFVGLECLKYFATRMGGLSADAGAFTHNNLYSFLASTTLSQSLFFNDTHWNGPSWSISAEFCTYALFGLIILLCRSRRSAVFVASLLFALGGAVYVWHEGYDFLILRCLLSFFIGVMVFNLAAVARKRTASWPGTLASVAVLVLLASRTWDSQDPWAMVFPPAFGALIYALAVSGHGPMKKVLETRPLVYLGTISYGIYMIHYAVWWVANQILRFVVQVKTFTTESGNTIISVENVWLATAVAVVGMGIIVTLAHFSYRYIEKPVMDWGWERRAVKLGGKHRRSPDRRRAIESL
jgi:peptidoglycan/LPS O-acetylase OafA/YrhL